MKSIKYVAGAFCVGVLVLGPAIPALAETATRRVVEDTVRDGNPPSSNDPSADHHWYREDTRAGGSVDLYKGGETGSPSTSGPPGFGDGALALTTNHEVGSKAQLLSTGDVFGRALADVNAFDYWTFQDAASEPPNGGVILPALQLQIDTNGLSTAGGFTTLVFEPYQETPTGPSQPIVPETWQFWDATSKQWWSSRAIHCEGGTPDPFDLAAGAGGAPFTTPADVAAACPGAVLLQVGVNVGAGGNPGAVTATDGLHIGIGADSYTYDFGPK